MHAKTDSEGTSLAASSPARSPRRPAYYVQSPSRDSHDGEKTATSFHSTPVLSPAGSPPHSSVGHHSRESSTSRFSGSLKPGSRKILPNEASGRRGQAKGGEQGKDWDVIEEEGFLDDEERSKGIPRRCYFLIFVVGFFVLFTLFSLILWGASRPQKPKITMKTIKFEEFKIQAGSDYSGVATDMITMNSTVKMTYRNTGTFFGVHVTSSPIYLSYSEINIATGALKKFHQSRKSQRPVTLTVTGTRIPMYGSGAGLSSSTGTTTVPIALKLSFTVKSRAYILGKLVKTKFNRKIDCNVTFDPKKINVAIPLKKSCTVE